MTRRHIALVLAVAIPILADGAGPPDPSGPWFEARVQQFRIFSNAGSRAVRRTAERLGELGLVLQQSRVLDVQTPVPTLVFVFKDDSSFTPFKMLYQGRPQEMNWSFLRGKYANYIAVVGRSSDKRGGVGYLYFRHAVADQMGYLPMWLSEGLAEFYLNSTVAENSMAIGKTVSVHRLWLIDSTPIPLDQLLVMDRFSPLIDWEDRRGTFFAESWALVHYLLLGNEERRNQLTGYIALLRGGRPDSEAFAAAFGGDHRVLEKELRSYLKRPLWTVERTTPEVKPGANIEIVKMSSADALFRLGDFLAQQGRHADAFERFDAVLRADPTHGPTLAAIARRMESEGRWDEARAAYERALRSAPDDPQIFFRWGRFLQDRGASTQQAEAALSRSTELDPSFAPAWTALATLYAENDPTSPEALRITETVYRLRPFDLDAFEQLLVLYLRMDRRDQAVAMIEGVFPWDLETRTAARAMVLAYDLSCADEVLKRGGSEAHQQARQIRDQVAREIERASDPELLARMVAEQHVWGCNPGTATIATGPPE